MSATPTISFEFFPPKTDEGRAKLATARKQLARFKPGFFFRDLWRRRHDA